jgi:hypothetical protein
MLTCGYYEKRISLTVVYKKKNYFCPMAIIEKTSVVFDVSSRATNIYTLQNA